MQCCHEFHDGLFDTFFLSLQQQHIIFSPVEVWRETKVGFGITAIRSRDSSSLLEAAEVRAAWQREIGRTDKSQRSRILTKIHQNNVELYTKRKEARIDLYGMDGTLKQIEDDSAACKWALNYYQLTIFRGYHHNLH